MVQELLRYTALHRVCDVLGGAGQQRRKRIRRTIQRRAFFLFQRRQRRQVPLCLLVKIRLSSLCLAISPTQQQRGRPVLQSLKKAMVGDAVLYLPPRQDHAHIGCHIHGGIAAGTPPLPDGVDGAPLFAGAAALRQEHSQKRQVIVEDHPSRRAVPLTQRMAQAAVGGLERLPFLLRQPVIRGPYISEHPSEQPQDGVGQALVFPCVAVIEHAGQEEQGRRRQRRDIAPVFRHQPLCQEVSQQEAHHGQ